jgi:hypothetical protein
MVEGNRISGLKNIATKISSCLSGMFVFDAVAAPTHWYYDVRNINQHYGSITGYTKPNEKLQGSIMSLSNTGGAGRGSN